MKHATQKKGMHALSEDPDCTRSSEMSEFNVMDFVETEYKSDEHEDRFELIRPRRKSQRKQKVSVRYECKQMDSTINSGFSSSDNKKYLKKRRKICTGRKLVFNDDDGDDCNKLEHFYPYLTLLKSLSSKVGRVNSLEEQESDKLFKQLSHTSLCYPYASLLQEVHEAAREDSGDNIFKRDDIDHLAETRVSQVMKSFEYKTSRLFEKGDQIKENNGKSFEVPFTNHMLNMIEDHKIQENSVVSCEDICGIGKILKMLMTELPEERPSKEFHSSAILQRLSLLVEKKNSNTVCHEDKKQLFLESSGESSQEEEVEWKPSRWCTGSSSEFVEESQRKRKSTRKKKTITKFDATPESYRSIGPKESRLYKRSNFKSQSLLQMILGNGNLQENLSGKFKDYKVRTEVLEKIKDRIKSRKALMSADRGDSTLCPVNQVEDCFESEESLFEVSGDSRKFDCNDMETLKTKGQRSLLKEYLLKPNEEKLISKGNCDIPTISGNSFLFSRLLQNFKAVSDNRLTCNDLEGLEETSGSSILREMLIETCKPFPNNGCNEELQDIKHFKPMEHIDLSSLRNLLSEQNCLDEDKIEFVSVKQEVDNDISGSNILRDMLVRTSSNSLLHLGKDDKVNDLKDDVLDICNHSLSLESGSSEIDSMDSAGPVCKIKCENFIETHECNICHLQFLSGVELANHEILCKIKCEVKCEDEFIDEAHECNICHLQFLSGIDLANHEMLFHCIEDTQTAEPPCLLQHGNEIVQKRLFGEKLPA